MAWPNSPVSTTQLATGAGVPKLARTALLAAVQAINAMMGERLPASQGGVPTGCGMDYWFEDLPDGWVWGAGRTIGKADSGATERANADCEALFTKLWDTYPDSLAPVSGGRGASAADDWAAGKTIAVMDTRGRVRAGRDDMAGTSAAGRLTTAGAGLDGTVLGGAGGAQTHTLTEAQIPAHTHNGNGMTNRNTASGGSDEVLIKNATANALSPAVNSTGGGQAHPNVQPTIICNYIVKL